MKLQDALNLLSLSGKVTFAEAKHAYRLACKKYHPDRNPAGLEMMKAVNAAWDILQGWDWAKEEVFVREGVNNNYGDALMEALNAIVNLPGITIEICGSWVWVGGNTRAVKEELKAAQFRWAPKKSMWYFRPPEFRSVSRGKYSIDEIREKYGSESYQGKGRREEDYLPA